MGVLEGEGEGGVTPGANTDIHKKSHTNKTYSTIKKLTYYFLLLKVLFRKEGGRRRIGQGKEVDKRRERGGDCSTFICY